MSVARPPARRGRMGAVKKALPLVVLIILAAVGVYFLTRGGGTSGPVAGDGLEDGSASPAPPPALGAAGRGDRPDPAAGRPPADGMDDASTVPESEALPHLKGFVVDAETGKGIAGARLGFEPPAAQCPRMPEAAPATYFEMSGARGAQMPQVVRRIVGAGLPVPQAGGAFTESLVGAHTGGDGSFDVEFAAKADLFVRAPGYRMECVCGVTSDTPITVRLVRGLSIEGVVVREDGQAVEGALVSVRPAPGTSRTLGHVEQALSGERGAFVVSGLVEGALTLSVVHGKHMPLTWSQPVDAGTKGLRVVLTPALFATFRVITDDGNPPNGPTLAWKTSGAASLEGLTMLLGPDDPQEITVDPAYVPEPQNPGTRDPAAPEDGPILRPGTVVYRPVAIPCSRPDVTFTVKAIGMEPWVSPPEPLPPEGGARTFDVALRRDPTLGSLRLFLEDRDGKALSWVGEKAQLAIGRRDAKPIPAGVLLQPSESLLLPALPEGPYLLQIRSPGHAPTTVETDVVAGRPAEAKVVVGPPAKVHVRFTAPEATMVQFRLMQGRELAWPFPERKAGDTTEQPDDDDGRSPSFVGGSDGITLSGLGAGRYTIEVLTPTLAAPPTTVDLVEGETREVEIAVSRK